MVGVHRRQLQVDRILGEAHGFEAAVGVPPDVGGGDLGVAEPRELQRDDAVRMGARPFLDVPVVPRPHARKAEFLILAVREDRAGEAGDE